MRPARPISACMVCVISRSIASSDSSLCLVDASSASNSACCCASLVWSAAKRRCSSASRSPVAPLVAAPLAAPLAAPALGRAAALECTAHVEAVFVALGFQSK